MKLAYVDLCGFRGYRKPLRIEFAGGFTVIDGRNGVGKSTICDAVEFALTGTIGKYRDAKSDGETVADYLWWSGDGPGPEQHYVEVGFYDGDKVLPVRREQLVNFDEGSLAEVVDKLCDSAMRPSDPVAQLCTASIIRDEHIAALSLDLTEVQRYALLCEAIGATDAEQWVERGRVLSAHARKRRELAERDVAAAAQEVSLAAKRIDELRAAVAEEAVVAAALGRLQQVAGSTNAVDSIAEVARVALSELIQRSQQLEDLKEGWSRSEASRASVADLRDSVLVADQAIREAEDQLRNLGAADEATGGAQIISQRARDLSALVQLGRRLGLDQGHCPLCASAQEPEAFRRGMAAAEEQARQLDAQAVAHAQGEEARRTARAALEAARTTADKCRQELARSEAATADFERRLNSAGLGVGGGLQLVLDQLQKIRSEVRQVQEDLGTIETVATSNALERAMGGEEAAKTAHVEAERQLGVARRAEQRAQALHDAARRAAGETLTHRLERVLPLMAELFRRLRPHPHWGDIEYKIRGDVRRFLKLQVGDELNPQFMFSSGQRRATGLAFLLSVNLSLAWSRWKTILLDDPVQHIDDFRSVHLVEVMAQLAIAGRQVVCVVEDPALADLICRRLPVVKPGDGTRITLGPDQDGALSKLHERRLTPLLSGALVSEETKVAG